MSRPAAWIQFLAKIIGVYVSDMGAAQSWAQPGIENWVLAEGALFVIGAKVAGEWALRRWLRSKKCTKRQFLRPNGVGKLCHWMLSPPKQSLDR
ncbi:MAG: nitrous oxide reductase accessory protein NosL [Shimia sp.]|uniref:nitrous oxide reductase accessory protein NosL n=1 Tax=Shimia sp. TaxID=1954381 RepID=UPI001B169CF8|nr:nitrous oxide reductase accessory protein NosL [Shimia sp.]